MGCHPIVRTTPALHAPYLRTGPRLASRIGASKAAASTQYQPASAKDAIETGLKLFNEEKNYTEAARLFNVALESPDFKANGEEKQAALYNLGCAYAKLKQYKPAADSIVRAINDHNLKLTVALQDNDLRDLRDRREWIDALTTVKGGMSREMKLDLRSEAKAPFRFPRLVILGGFALGAAIGLLIISTRLFASIKGGEGAPDLTESLQNFGINSAVLAVLGAVLYRDAQSKQKSLQVTDREELLSRLQVDLGNGRVLPLIKFRGQLRPIILAGTRSFVDKAIKDAEPYYESLRERGVSVVPLVMGSRSEQEDPEAKIRALKREFRKEASASKGFGEVASAPEPSKASSDSSKEKVGDEDKKWKLVAHDPEEWQEWVKQQKVFANLKGDLKNVYMQVQLDGTVRTSGAGVPNWPKMVDDLGTLDSIRTTLTDGIGPSI